MSARLYCRVVGDGARPRYRDGEYLILMPDRACEPGDDVVLEMQDGTHRLCEITAIGPEAIAIVPPEGAAGVWEVLSHAVVARMFYVTGRVHETPVPACRHVRP